MRLGRRELVQARKGSSSHLLQDALHGAVLTGLLCVSQASPKAQASWTLEEAEGHCLYGML